MWNSAQREKVNFYFSATREGSRIYITKNRDLFHLWWKENLVKHKKFFNYYDHDFTHNFPGVLKFHLSKKSNKYVMFIVISALELLWNKRNQTIRKKNGIWIWIQLPLNEDRLKISSKKSTFNLLRNYLKLHKHQLSSLKNKKPRI